MRQVILIVEDAKMAAVVAAILPYATDFQVTTIGPKPVQLEAPPKGGLEAFRQQSRPRAPAKKTPRYGHGERQPSPVVRRLVMDLADQRPQGFPAGVVTALARQHGGITKLYSNQLHMLKSGGYLDASIDPATGKNALPAHGYTLATRVVERGPRHTSYSRGRLMTVMICRCGSGLKSRELYDAAGIYVQRVCDWCEERVRSGLNPAIFDAHSMYSLTGDERDLLVHAPIEKGTIDIEHCDWEVEVDNDPD